MSICDIRELVNKSFNIKFVNALYQSWHNTRSFRCIGKPKKENLFLYLDGCKITYTDKDNRTYTAKSGDVVYTPVGSEYKAELYDFEGSLAHTVGVNFFLFDEAGESVTLAGGIKIFTPRDKEKIARSFDKILSDKTGEPIIKKRILLMEILSSLSVDAGEKYIPENIKKALNYLSENIEKSPTVKSLAEISKISEVYFRRQFKEYLGESPCEYRNRLRLKKAATYLEYGEIRVQEISDSLGYATVSHFIKEFRREYGMSPLKYRTKNMSVK